MSATAKVRKSLHEAITRVGCYLIRTFLLLQTNIITVYNVVITQDVYQSLTELRIRDIPYK